MPDAQSQKEMVPCPNCNGKGKCLPQFNTLKELLNFMLKQPAGEWSPGWFYNNDGDQIEIYWQNVSTIARTLGETGIVLHEDRETGEVVGVTIRGILRRLAFEALQEVRCKPHPVEPIKCPICGMEPTPPNGLGKLLYSREPIECEKCGHTYGGDKR